MNNVGGNSGSSANVGGAEAFKVFDPQALGFSFGRTVESVVRWVREEASEEIRQGVKFGQVVSICRELRLADRSLNAWTELKGKLKHVGDLEELKPLVQWVLDNSEDMRSEFYEGTDVKVDAIYQSDERWDGKGLYSDRLSAVQSRYVHCFSDEGHVPVWARETGVELFCVLDSKGFEGRVVAVMRGGEMRTERKVTPIMREGRFLGQIEAVRYIEIGKETVHVSRLETGDGFLIDGRQSTGKEDYLSYGRIMYSEGEALRDSNPGNDPDAHRVFLKVEVIDRDRHPVLKELDKLAASFEGMTESQQEDFKRIVKRFDETRSYDFLTGELQAWLLRELSQVHERFEGQIDRVQKNNDSAEKSAGLLEGLLGRLGAAKKTYDNELDSLADVIAWGKLYIKLAPAVVVFFAVMVAWGLSRER